MTNLEELKKVTEDAALQKGKLALARFELAKWHLYLKLHKEEAIERIKQDTNRMG